NCESSRTLRGQGNAGHPPLRQNGMTTWDSLPTLRLRREKDPPSGERRIMTTAVDAARPIAWWKEPTKDQWYAYFAAWAAWTLDAFDFTAFLLLMAPIAKEFDVPVSDVAALLTITLRIRPRCAIASAWRPPRVARQPPPTLLSTSY